MTREKLATLPADTLVYKNELATAFQCSEKSIDRHVIAGMLPPPFRLGRKRAWRVASLNDHMQKVAQRAEEEHARFEELKRKHSA